MNIAINTRFLLARKLEGFGWFTLETVKRITQQHPEHHFIFLFDRPYDKKFIFSDNITPVVIGPPARHPFLFYWWFEFSVKKALKKHKADLFFSPDGYLSLSSPVPSVNVIHDLNFEHSPGDLRFFHRHYYLKFFPCFAQKAKRIITVSEYSKKDIVSLYKIPPGKIDVAYNGTGEHFFPVDENTKHETRQKLARGNEYFVFVGALHPRKNLAGMFAAFDRFKTETGSPVQFVIVGEKYFWNRSIQSAYEGMKYKQDVVFTGHLDSENLRNTVASSLALIFVSFFEGFGLPLTEAMKCGVPVLTSNTTSLAEIAAGAALTVNPASVEEISSGMKQLAGNPGLREELVKKGNLRCRDFSWDKTAEEVWNSIMKVAHAEGLS